MFALTSELPLTFGSFTKYWPLRVPGGSVPVSMYLRHSMIVVLPQPFEPTIIVSGE